MLSALKLGSRLTFIGGKGGVGKTTVAAALAVELTDGGGRVLAISVDPAHSLGDAFGVELGPDPRPVGRQGGLTALEVDPRVERERFEQGHGAALASLIERGTYLDASDLDSASDLTLPGTDEIAALLRLVRLTGKPDVRIIVDTAPTGHTLRLLELPRLALQWLGALDAMQAKHHAIVLALAGSTPRDASTALLAELRTELEAFEEILRRPDLSRFVLVTTPEPAVLAETMRYRDRLELMGVAIGGVVVNRDTPSSHVDGGEAVVLHVPRLPEDPVGVQALRRFAASAVRTRRPWGDTAGDDPSFGLAAGEGASERSRRVSDLEFHPPGDRTLYLIAGKGGVGKSTVAAATALYLAERHGRKVLLLSIDPAGSLSDILKEPVGDTAAPLGEVPSLHTRQLNAEGAWNEFRSRHREQVERMVEAMLPGGGSARLDQEVLERVIDLAPSGIDELMALMEVIDLLGDREYDALVVDTAPTGHFLRLLELPELALRWTHALLRLYLKYRSAVPLAELGERTLQLAKELRQLKEMLSDPRRTWIGVVALPEALSLPETRRLLTRCRSIGVSPSALIVNRVPSNGRESELKVMGALRQLGEGINLVAAPAVEGGALGLAALRRFIAAWRVSTSASPMGSAE